jgi:hypothetical protein
MRICRLLFLALVVLSVGMDWAHGGGDDALRRWPADKANAWYDKQPWLVGCNFTPSSAINQLEVWQEETFDPQTIDRELGWAEGIGFNTARVFLHDLAWEADVAGFKKRLDRYLEIADRHRIRTLFVLFDDCWTRHPKVGKQPQPIPGMHNSGWVQSPGEAVVVSPEYWDRLKRYVTDVVGSFGKDRRVLAWDLYNEPGNEKLGEKSLPLLRATFAWARAAAPEQPLTAGTWFNNAKLNEFQMQASDVITFHNYDSADALRKQIHELKKLGRPVICTEYMARPRGSRFETHLPIFKEEHVGCYCWGFVSGKTQTIYPWGSPKGAPEPKLWFHDLFRKDGSVFDEKEIALIKKLTRGGEK